MKYLTILSITILIICNCSSLKINTSGQEKIPQKFKKFTFSEDCQEDILLTEIYNDLKDKKTILDLLKFYSDELLKDPNINSLYFKKIQKIFECGLTPHSMHGYYHGAVIAFRNEALLKILDINTLNLKWPLVRFFSPWTGKTFEKINKEKLIAITNGFIRDENQVAWGANTYTTRSAQKMISVELMKFIGIKLVRAEPKEIETHDYNMKGFFFIGMKGKSVNPNNKGKIVYQINYRWLALHTFPPDNYCIDELVQIADGLYLGQLLYATNLSLKYDPNLDPRIYQYKNFGFWLLMDDDWQRRRKEIRFDLNY